MIVVNILAVLGLFIMIAGPLALLIFGYLDEKKPYEIVGEGIFESVNYGGSGNRRSEAVIHFLDGRTVFVERLYEIKDPIKGKKIRVFSHPVKSAKIEIVN